MFIQARNYHRGRIEPIELLVVHDMEAPQGADTAENVARWFAGPTAPQASAHECIDQDSWVGCVNDWDTAWHAPGANANGIGFELAGYGRETRADWLAPLNVQMLRIAAQRLGLRCRSYGIPVRFLDAGTLAQYPHGGIKGITTHWEVTKAFHQSDHTDPGTNFPMDVFLGLVNEALGVAPAPNNGDILNLDAESQAFIENAMKGQAMLLAKAILDELAKVETAGNLSAVYAKAAADAAEKVAKTLPAGP